MKLEEEIVQKKFKSEYQKLAINILYTANWINSLNFNLLKDKTITSQQYNILRILKGQYPNAVTLKVIRERMLDKMSDVSRLVDKLKTKGLVHRKQNPNDRRSVDILITPKGLKLLDDLKEIDHLFDKKFKTISLSEAKQINELLDKLRG
jgi:DNA-binding MarR family transcriptional regulator